MRILSRCKILADFDLQEQDSVKYEVQPLTCKSRIASSTCFSPYIRE